METIMYKKQHVNIKIYFTATDKAAVRENESSPSENSAAFWYNAH